MKPSTQPVSGWHQRGVTLLEILITMVVVALGLLGFAALQTVSMKSNRVALYHSYATSYADDILDRMRANRANLASYVIAMGADAPAAPLTVAQQDLSDWLTSLAVNLPAGDGQVDRNAATGVITVTIQWDDGASGIKRFVTGTSL